ncbi:MAG: hypothetical protein H7Y60_11405 [Rhodospirillaceae bacterium]|nr:hypothetical protein [Rhodospirillales bacterium]
MVDTLDIAKHAQAAANLKLAAAFHPAPSSSQQASQSFDNVVLSAQARSVIDTLRQDKTVAEAWLDHVTAPPDPTKPVVRSDSSGTTEDDKGASAGAHSNAQLQQAFDTTMTDLSWLFDAMNQPKADTLLVAQAVIARMATDNVGVSPPLPEMMARAQQTSSAVALYVENLSITMERGQVTNASVDRVALTTVHDSLRERVSGRDRPLVLDVGGALQEVGSQALGNTATDQVSTTPEARSIETIPQTKAASPDTGLRTDDMRHALLIVRHKIDLPIEDTITVKLDALFPIE